jgi:homoserine kinase
MLTVRAPATSANLGSGFDVFGVALERPADVVRVEKAAETTISVSGAGSQFIPEDPKSNTVGAVAEALDAPAHIQIDKGVRPASGLGSSAASAAAAAVALNRLYDRGKSREELVPIAAEDRRRQVVVVGGPRDDGFPIAAEGEAVVSGAAHDDNVAPSILGGFTIATDRGVTRVPADVPLVACLPDIVVSTRDARDVIPDGATVDQLVETVGNAASLTTGMHRDDPALVGRGMEDSVVTPARAELIDGYEAVREAAFEAGATGVTISGAGPAILAACHGDDQRAIASAVLDAFGERDVDAQAYKTGIGRGVKVF